MMHDCDVALVSGAVTHTAVDYFFPSRLPLYLARRYSSDDPSLDIFGVGWKSNLGARLWARDGAVVLGGTFQPDVVFTPDPQGGMADAGGRARLLNDPRGFLISQDHLNLLFASAPRPDGTFPLVRRFDPFGNFNTFDYDDRNGRLTRLTDNEGREITLNYADGLLVEVHLQHITLQRSIRLSRFTYDARRRLIACVSAGGSIVKFEYEDHRLVAYTNRNGGTTYYAYDNNGRCVDKWRTDGSARRHFDRDDVRHAVFKADSLGYRWVYSLNEMNRVIREVDPIGRVAEDIYDARGAVIFHGLNIIGPPCVMTWDAEARTEISNCSGRMTKTMYDATGKPIKVIAPNGGSWQLRYDDEDRVIEQLTPSGLSVQLGYDDTGNIREITTSDGDRAVYESRGLEHVESDTLGIVTRRQLDIFGNTLRATDAVGNSMQLAYTADGLLSEMREADGAVTSFLRTPGGQLAAIHYPSGDIVSFDVDGFGRLRRRSGGGEDLTVTMDGEDRPIAITDANGRSLTLSYDAVGRIDHVRHFHGAETRVEYDSFDNPRRIFNPESNTETRARFNEFGEPVERSSTLGVRWIFDYGSAGELASAQSELGSWSFDWDAQLRLVAERNPFREVQISRDALGRVTSFVDDRGLRLEYAWDRRSRLIRLSINGRWVYRFTYDPRGLILEIACPTDLFIQFSYDVKSRMVNRRLVRGASGEVVAERTIEWNTSDCVVGYDDALLGRRELLVDGARRLLGVRQNGSELERYRHDDARNLMTDGDGTPLELNNRNQVVRAGRITFEFDADGQLRRRTTPAGVEEYEFDGDGQLLRIGLADGREVRYAYDFLGRRIRKVIGEDETHYLWDGIALQGEIRSGQVPRWFVTLPGSPIPLATVEGDTIHTLLFDQIGTVTDAFDESGLRSWACDAQAFGLIRQETGFFDQPIRALGQYHDRETGLYYNWRRYYDPLVGRYISVDPEPYLTTMNVYVYSPNPTIWVDVTGKGSLSGGVLTLNPRCDWTAKQMADFCQKIADMNDAIAGKTPKQIQVTRNDYENYDRGCATAAKLWDRNCAGKPGNSRRPVGKLADNPCTDNDADHKLEKVLGGQDDCGNLTPRNASVNRSCGPQIDNALEEAFKNPSVSGVTITSVIDGTCNDPKPNQTSCNGRSGSKGC